MRTEAPIAEGESPPGPWGAATGSGIGDPGCPLHHHGAAVESAAPEGRAGEWI